MNISPINHFKVLLADLNRNGFAWEVAALLGCVAAAWLAVWLLRRAFAAESKPEQGADSVLFGRNGIDGILFPIFSLAFVYLLRVTVFAAPEFALFRIATLMLAALAAIRLIARVVKLAYPDSSGWRVIERFFSWVIWFGVVLWLAGVLPIVTAELESLTFSLGKSKVSLLGMFEGILAALGFHAGTAENSVFQIRGWPSAWTLFSKNGVGH